MTDREKAIKGLEKIAEFFKARGDMAVGDGKMLLLSWMRAAEDAIALLKAQEQVINDMYSRYEGLCKEIREKYESDDVCGLCQYDGAYVGDSGDWMNECPGFGTNDCFCMKNSVRKMCGQPLIEEP